MQALRLSELNQIVKRVLGQHMEASYWLVAEIAEMRVAQAGHCYLELVEKEDQQIFAKIRANIWATQFRVIRSYFESSTGEALKAGMKVLMNVSVQFHKVYGISLVIKNIDPSYTLGERQRKRQEVIRQLEEDGVLDMNKQLSLPIVAQKIAVISSPTAAGYGDFMDQIQSNRYGYKVETRLFAAIMQGEGAPESIITALHSILSSGQTFDALILIRGGGASVDLDCFDDYELCAHLAQFPLPVITGIGHERDETVADLVAYQRLKTPTAVAEYLIDRFRTYEERLLEYLASIHLHAGGLLEQKKEDINQLNQRLQRVSQQLIQKKEFQLQYLKKNLWQQGKYFLKGKQKNLQDLHQDLVQNTKSFTQNKQKELQQYTRLINSSDPQQILKKGFTITYIGDKLASNSKDLVKGQHLKTITKDHIIESIIEEVKPNE